MMRHILLIVLSGIFYTLHSHAQWLDSDLYDQPLTEVLTRIESRYGVKIQYREKNVKDKIVYRAPWKFYDEVETTLENILLSLIHI